MATQTNLLRQIVKKKNNWNFTTEHSEAFTQLKKLRKYRDRHTLAPVDRTRTVTTDTKQKVKGQHSSKNKQTVTLNH